MTWRKSREIQPENVIPETEQEIKPENERPETEREVQPENVRVEDRARNTDLECETRDRA